VCGTVFPIKHFSKEEIANFKKDPSAWQKDINEKREQLYSGIDSLLKMREKWIQ
jgi:hypothetical protein